MPQYELDEFLVKSIEKYSNVGAPDLPVSNDAAQAFMNEFSNSGVQITWWYDDLAWQEDWWTYAEEGYNFISSYDLVIFIGHGSPGSIVFGRRANGTNRLNTRYVDLTGWVLSGSPETHPDSKTKWIILASCQVLRDDNPWTGDDNVYYIASRMFTGRHDDIWDWNDLYLHIIVGMYTDFAQTNGFHQDIASPTLKEFAQKLKEEYNVMDSWFKAVADHQKDCILGYCNFVGRAAVVAPLIIYNSPNGDSHILYFYDETLYSINGRPIDIVNYFLSHGYTVTLGWTYIVQNGG